MTRLKWPSQQHVDVLRVLERRNNPKTAAEILQAATGKRIGSSLTNRSIYMVLKRAMEEGTVSKRDSVYAMTAHGERALEAYKLVHA